MGHAKTDFTEQEMLGLLIKLVNESQRVSIESLNIRRLGNGNYRTSVNTTVYYPSVVTPLDTDPSKQNTLVTDPNQMDIVEETDRLKGDNHE